MSKALIEETDNTVEVIVKYNGDIEKALEPLNVLIEILSPNYAIITLKREQVGLLRNYREIEYIEEPRRLYAMLDNSLYETCIEGVRNNLVLDVNLTGKGVLIGIIDSGIDYTHPDFRNDDGTTRITHIWDQTGTGTPPSGFYNGAEYTSADINNALQSENPLDIVPVYDSLNHGTHVSGIAAGNGRASGGKYEGAAPESSLVVVKLGNTGIESFSRSTEIMRAIKYIMDKALEMNMPVAINLSFGTNNGSHNGNSLFENYIDSVCEMWKCVICVASGNEGAAGHHYSDTIKTNEESDAEFIITEGIKNIQLYFWKNSADVFNIEIIAPSGNTSGILRASERISERIIDGNRLFINFVGATPYSVDEEIYIELMGENLAGTWILKVYGENVVFGEFDVWLPINESVTEKTSFLTPDIYTTLTIPSSAQRVITVGGYNAVLDSASDFSGRGNTRQYNFEKPDIVAPSVGIVAPISGGGYDALTGTSMATPFVTGAAALLMEWGIVQGNSPYLYGQKLKAYLRMGARRQDYLEYPNRIWGYGSLCLTNSLIRIINRGEGNLSIYTEQQNNGSLEDAVYSEDYMDFVVEYNAYSAQIIENSPYIKHCRVIDGRYIVIYVHKDNLYEFYQTDRKSLFINEPFLMGLMDKGALEASGILRVQNQPYLSLRGQDVLIGIIDTGIDYTNDVFKYENGETKILSILDQSIRGSGGELYCYGTEYTREDINSALKSENPLEIVPSTDESGHGTFLASIMAGRSSDDNFLGAAPDAELIVVKLKEAKGYLRENKAVYGDVIAYQSNDVMEALGYIYAKSLEAGKPVAVCIGLGTNVTFF